MRFLNLMGCSGRRKRPSDNSFPALLGAEDPALAAVVEPVVVRAKSCRSPLWRPALTVISEDAESSADSAAGRRAAPALAKRGSVKLTSRVLPQATERNTWYADSALLLLLVLNQMISPLT
ncbi:hypothetical protein KSP39_PZI010176 [Platanthera zijinensis]|uniref:Uncharacterized protein n=1 Tax=Platanthera zijinensis TaxID=2320716 RepID=A0AAP0BI04_9ASPA